MERVTGVSESQASWITRFLYRRLKKRMGLVSKTKMLAAHHTPTLLATTWMDSVCASPLTVPFSIKAIVQLKVAMLVGCPF